MMRIKPRIDSLEVYYSSHVIFAQSVIKDGAIVVITLESTTAAFAAWRATKANDNTPTPAELWDMVRHLRKIAVFNKL